MNDNQGSQATSAKEVADCNDPLVDQEAAFLRFNRTEAVRIWEDAPVIVDVKE